MKKLSSSSVILLAILGLVGPLRAVELEQRSLKGLIAAAEAIVAVEVLSTDYTATPADEPMVAVAKVLKVFKGPLRKGNHVRFTETAWVGPTYQKGEYRILFLEQAKSSLQESRRQSLGVLRTTRWRILSHLYAKENFLSKKRLFLVCRWSLWIHSRRQQSGQRIGWLFGRRDYTLAV